MKKTVCFIQARISSSRFPGKVLKKFFKHLSILEYLILRAKKIDNVNDVIVITSSKIDDNKIFKLCRSKKIKVFRGSLKNVFLRLVNSTKKYNASTIIHLTADNPFLDYEMAGKMLNYFKKKNINYLINNDFNGKKRKIPNGMEVQIINQKELLKVYSIMSNNKDMFDASFFEHISLYFNKNKNKKSYESFKIPKKLQAPTDVRLTIDYKEDLKILKNLAKKLKKYNFNSANFRKILLQNKKILTSGKSV